LKTAFAAFSISGSGAPDSAVFETEGKSPTFDLVTKSYSNLLRRWAEG
jgi:hypothetical protein